MEERAGEKGADFVECVVVVEWTERASSTPRGRLNWEEAGEKGMGAEVGERGERGEPLRAACCSWWARIRGCVGEAGVTFRAGEDCEKADGRDG